MSRATLPIPNALHICPNCCDLASGELYCDRCRYLGDLYRERLNEHAPKPMRELNLMPTLALVALPLALLGIFVYLVWGLL